MSSVFFFSVGFLLLLIPGHGGSWPLSAIAEGCIQTVCENSMWTFAVLDLQCGCVTPAASVYADSLITQFRQSHNRNGAVGEKLGLLYYNQVPSNWAYLTVEWGSYERALFHVLIKSEIVTLLLLSVAKEFQKRTFAGVGHFLRACKE